MWSSPGTSAASASINGNVNANGLDGHANSDPVVSEFPVFLSNALSQSLYLIQYPLRPRAASSDDYNLLHAQFKPSQEKLQLTYEINTEVRYDENKGERYEKDLKSVGSNRDELNDEDGTAYLQEHTLESSLPPKCPNPPIYAVAIIKNGQVHLTPIKNILQMKPIFPHVNASDLRRKENKENQMDIDDDETDEPPPEASKVTVKFTEKRESHNKKPTTSSAKSKHFSAFEKKLSEEQWIPLEPTDDTEDGDSKRELIMNKLISTNTESKMDGVGVLEPKSYFNLLFPKSSDKLVLDLNYKCSSSGS